jgi:hypothetical protein
MRRCYAIILIWAAAGCSSRAMVERIVDHDDMFARAYFDSVRFARLAYAGKVLSPALSQVPGVRDSLARLATALPGHRFQVRYVRGTFSRAHGTRKSDFDPW